jgi:hypothetical protein
MKLFTRSNLYKTSNLTFNPSTLEGFSYDWYSIIKKIDNKLVLNTYRYSNTTCKHISKIRRLVVELGLTIDLEIEAPQGLQSLNDSKLHYESLVKEKNKELEKGRTSKREERLKQLCDLENKLNWINLQLNR